MKGNLVLDPDFVKALGVRHTFYDLIFPIQRDVAAEGAKRSTSGGPLDFREA